MSDVLSIDFTPGYTFAEGEVLTLDKLNSLGRPTINLNGAIGSALLLPNSVSTDKLVDGLLSADATGRGKMQDGYVTTSKLADDSVVTSKILDTSVTTTKLADASVTAVKLEETLREGVAQYGPGTWSSGTYAVTLTPAATGYTTGMRVVFKADAANTGPVDINVNGQGVKNVFAGATAELVAGQIAAGQIVEVVYDGTAFQWIGNASGAWFVTAETAIAGGKIIDVAHGRGRVPDFRWRLRCKTTDLGYSVGDEIDAGQAGFSWGTYSVESRAFCGGANGTNIWCTCSNVLWSIAHKTTGTITNATSANWVVVGYAR